MQKLQNLHTRLQNGLFDNTPPVKSTSHFIYNVFLYLMHKTKITEFCRVSTLKLLVSCLQDTWSVIDSHRNAVSIQLHSFYRVFNNGHCDKTALRKSRCIPRSLMSRITVEREKLHKSKSEKGTYPLPDDAMQWDYNSYNMISSTAVYYKILQYWMCKSMCNAGLLRVQKCI